VQNLAATIFSRKISFSHGDGSLYFLIKTDFFFLFKMAVKFVEKKKIFQIKPQEFILQTKMT